jgi:hypothetical protein
MLSDTLVTNEVKNAAGTEVEFNRISVGDREVIFAMVGENPSSPHRLSVKHLESGSGLNRRRRSLVRIDKTSISSVDSVTPVTTSAYVVVDSPIGAVTTTAEAKACLAELGSFVHTLATTTHLYDGTGNGAAALLNGTI